MAYYTRSSLAYDFTLFEEDDYMTNARTRARAKGKSAKSDGTKLNDGEAFENGRETLGAARSRKRRTNFFRAIFGAVVSLAIVFIVASIIHGQVQLTELNQEIANAKSQLAEQQSVYTQLEMKVDSSISTTVVEDYAKNKLKMNKAVNSQKEFVNLSDGDKAEVSLSKDKNIFESIAEAFSSLWS